MPDYLIPERLASWQMGDAADHLKPEQLACWQMGDADHLKPVRLACWWVGDAANHLNQSDWHAVRWMTQVTCNHSDWHAGRWVMQVTWNQSDWHAGQSCCRSPIEQMIVGGESSTCMPVGDADHFGEGATGQLVGRLLCSNACSLEAGQQPGGTDMQQPGHSDMHQKHAGCLPHRQGGSKRTPKREPRA